MIGLARIQDSPDDAPEAIAVEDHAEDRRLRLGTQISLHAGAFIDVKRQGAPPFGSVDLSVPQTAETTRRIPGAAPSPVTRRDSPWRGFDAVDPSPSR